MAADVVIFLYAYKLDFNVKFLFNLPHHSEAQIIVHTNDN